MDTNSGLVVLSTALGTKDLIVKLLGPTADYLGAGLRDWSERRIHNIAKIFERAAERLGDRIQSEGSVSPRVLRGILDQGSFCSDEVATEYFGGVLASSRTDAARDDRGVYFVDLLAKLSAYQIRSHYIFYSVVKSVFDDKEWTVLTPDGRERLLTFVPSASYISAMDFSDKEDAAILINHILFGLSREALIEPYFRSGSAEHLTGFSGAEEESGLAISPSPMGVELFHWAHGMGNIHIAKFLDRANRFTSAVGIPVPAGREARRQG